MKLSADYVRSILDYDKETGNLRWKPRQTRRGLWNIKFAGKIAGTSETDGRRKIVLKGKPYQHSHVAWVIVTGEWPRHEVDHLDTNPANNKWSNLREATRVQQLHNRCVMGNSTTGLKGVHKNKHGTTYNARIRVKGRRLFVGNFPTAEDAHAAYCIAASKYYGEFARTS